MQHTASMILVTIAGAGGVWGSPYSGQTVDESMYAMLYPLHFTFLLDSKFMATHALSDCDNLQQQAAKLCSMNNVALAAMMLRSLDEVSREALVPFLGDSHGPILAAAPPQPIKTLVDWRMQYEGYHDHKPFLSFYQLPALISMLTALGYDTKHGHIYRPLLAHGNIGNLQIFNHPTPEDRWVPEGKCQCTTRCSIYQLGGYARCLGLLHLHTILQGRAQGGRRQG